MNLSREVRVDRGVVSLLVVACTDGIIGNAGGRVPSLVLKDPGSVDRDVSRRAAALGL